MLNINDRVKIIKEKTVLDDGREFDSTGDNRFNKIGKIVKTTNSNKCWQDDKNSVVYVVKIPSVSWLSYYLEKDLELV